MRASLILGVGAASIAMAFGCGNSSGTGGSGGTGTTATSSTSKSSSSSSKSSTTGTTTSGSGTGGAGGGTVVNCNPVKDTECDVAGGEGCDYDTTGFICYLGPDNTVDNCGACDPTGATTPFCKDGYTCMPVDAGMTMGKCIRFCCTDADCGGTAGSCNKALSGDPNVGLCGAPDPTNKFVMTPVCSGVPATPPSNGSCYTTPP